MTQALLPPIWLLILIAGLPQLSETVYTPSLPDIAHRLQTYVAMVEYTLTIYLFGFALGTLFWGKISDKLGRKPCIIAGLLIFIIGCISCYFSNSIESLMMSRLVQAFGGSIGSVLGQAVCRDAFHGIALGRVYSVIGSAFALFSAIGPLCGGIIAEMFGWRSIFIFLIIFALVVMILVVLMLPETHPYTSRKRVSMWSLATQLILDKNVVGFGLIVAGCNGIIFSYFAEGPFYLIKGLGLSTSHYSFSFTVIALSTMMGGIVSKKLHSKYSSKEIMEFGLLIIAVATAFFSLLALINHHLLTLSPQLMITVTILSQMGGAFGICMATSNALALALVDYKHAIGSASSLFGFFYYFLISIFTFFMGFLHNGTLLPMPIYFLSLSCFMIAINHMMLKNK